VNQTVRTPYGLGKVLKLEDDGRQIVVEPLTWTMANNQKPTFYMNPADVKPFYGVNDDIECAFGKGVVQSIRDLDGIYIVTLTNWQLADGKSPTLYLNESSLSKPKKVELKPPSVNCFENLYKLALSAKESAKNAYLAQDFVQANYHYANAVEILRVCLN
jgi:hypothetical protein